MRGSSNIISSIARSEVSLRAALPAPIEVRPVRSARRLRQRFDEASGTLRLTCPSRMSRRAALAWALDQRGWIETQIAKAGSPEPFVPGASIPVDGRERRIAWAEDAPRTPVLREDEIRCGGPEAAVPRRIEKFLKQLALATMSAEVAKYTAAAGVSARSVSVGDAATRWGSCSSSGAIRLSWRLLLAPTEVRRYVVAHEVAHLVHLHHGPEFKALEARLFGPGVAQAKANLRRIGPRLRRLGLRR
jgi:predicted metal-dependent hydrolase